MVRSKKPIFVVGAPRSGTTLTATIIGNHADVFMPGECHFFEMSPTPPLQHYQSGDRARAIDELLGVYGLYNQAEDQRRVDSIFADAGKIQLLEKSATCPGRLFDEFMVQQLASVGGTRWGNQAPKDIFHASKILSVFPDAHFVVCVRDCRDFLLSYKNRWRVSEHGARLRQLYHPVLTSLLWRSTLKQLERLELSTPTDQLSVLRYEDLVQAPEATIQQLCRDLALEYDPGLISDVGHNSSVENAGSGIFDASVGRWRESLDATEAAVAQRINRDLLVRYGYEMHDLDASLGRWLEIWASLPLSVGRALWANRANRGPLVPYLLNRLR